MLKIPKNLSKKKTNEKKLVLNGIFMGLAKYNDIIP